MEFRRSVWVVGLNPGSPEMQKFRFAYIHNPVHQPVMFFNKKNQTMEKFKRLLLLIALAPFFIAAHAQTADEIIAKHIEAIGGKDKISQIKSIVIQNSVQAMGNESPNTTTLLAGKGFKSVSEFNGQQMVQVYTDTAGWQINPFMGGSDPQPFSKQEYDPARDQIYVGGALFDYASKGYKAELLGKDGNNYKIKLTSDRNAVTYWIDATTYYISKMTFAVIMMGQPAEATKTFSDYRKTEFGYVLPFKWDLDLGQFQLSYVVKKVEFNSNVDPSVFVMPK